MAEATCAPVCFFYIPYSGGKFLANCLALSRHVLCNNSFLARTDLNFKEPIGVDYYNFKLKSVVESLPNHLLLTQQWKEFGDIPADIIRLPSASSKLLCHVSHTNEQLEKLLKAYPSLQIIKLVNYRRFNQDCFGLKSPTVDLKRHMSGFNHWDCIAMPTQFDFDIDTIYQIDNFLVEIKRLYDFLNLDDFQPALIQQFHRSYVECHGPEFSKKFNLYQ